MAKLMEVIEKKDDLANNRSTIKLLETTFKTLGKVLGSDPGKNWETFASNDIFSVHGLQSLNTEEKRLANRFVIFKDDFNVWIDSIKSKIPALSDMTHNVIVNDYAFSYVPDITPVTYQRVLADIAIAERILYEGAYNEGQDKLNQNLQMIKDWSKTKNYGSNISSINSKEFEMISKCNWSNSRITSNVSGVTAVWVKPSSDSSDHNTDKNRLKISGLDKLSLNQTVQISGYAYEYGGRVGSLYCTVKRTALGVTIDDGRTSETRTWGSGSRFDKINGVARTTLKNIPSPHFDVQGTRTVYFGFLKSRVYI